MYIAIATEDFDIFKDDWSEAFSTETENPIFTGATVEEVNSRIERFFFAYADQYGIGTVLPEYEICEITTVGIFKGVCNFTTAYCPINSD